MTTPQHLSDRYELGEILGYGGMSEVHLARDQRLNRDVAIKVLRADLARDPSFYLRFRREAQNAAALNHPAIVAVYDTGEAETPTGPLPYIVMEYVDGITLRDIVKDDGPMPIRRAIEVIADSCQALNFSHQHGIIHRDVKPANIMISKTGAVKVMDFGIARAVSDAGVSVTQTAAVIGTAQYLSPEQARGETVDARSDVYSLGCVLYELLTGEPPFVGDSPVAVAYQHVREDPVAPSKHNPEIPPGLDSVVLKALSKNPDNRYQNAAEMRTDLMRVYQGEQPEAPKVLTDAERSSMLSTPSNAKAYPASGPQTNPLPSHYAEPRRNPLSRWLVGLAALVVLTVVVTFAIILGNGPSRDVQVPDVTGKSQADAVAALQNLGFKTKIQKNTSSKLAPERVIDTDPAKGSTVTAGSEVTLNVSIGPESQQVPDCHGLSFGDAVKKLQAAGFKGTFTQSETKSLPEDKGRVMATNPPAGQYSAVTNNITIVVGKGPGEKPAPDLVGQNIDVALKNLPTYGFTAPPTVIPVPSPESKGQILSTNPAAGTMFAEDGVIEIRVSQGGQFRMPSLVGKFWTDAEPMLYQAGWQGGGLTTEDVPSDGNNRARVVSQDPPAGAGVNYNGPIKLRFGAG
ncbi:serine/threonine protein kinase [Mycobacteroides chelonae]|jgi:serine/threonine-protein kinase|uniref:Stk1 family PASTA domain-containing Ser/Thr kinase n=1 Tax=Mycobacteroides chelonae TaxID=1774 RepID=UPI0007A0E25D|nr:Stk1 family PASTA domain-containing Ser/Thr kinase [Mycobacteroides chelonae]AMW17773.1 serine/threonine protein kinase [Mycobacterium sp. QIA-37]PKQ59416.1 serine/threonine protein kinase [Mycobacterium sp. MHSD3]SKO41179.1 Probable serine/threonine-protein kinase PknB [Mycobacteroides abscessus subsp. bolletii]MBF9524075.1 Stk1 family PASTA domain-containing Ser/Thr kinase [Mycobacteroides chelonae]MBV0919591.1 Stk1 family PASTA domain-containing Ser/Thr kinase [Mycobacteroides chelonae]